MTPAKYDVIAIGNAIVDVLSRVPDVLLTQRGLTKGAMQLIDAAAAEDLYAAMGPAMEMSGGSAANTLAGLAGLGRKCAFIGQVADDQLGAVFVHDMTALGVAFTTAPRPGFPPTARCLILVSPDGQRTMNTFLGASQFLPPAALDEAAIADSHILYLEGYLWDPDEPRAAMRRAIAVARAAGRRVALTLSDAFVIARHGDDFRSLLASGAVDILFANESEITALARLDDFDAAVAAIAPHVPMLVVTRGANGAIAVADGTAVAVAAEPIDAVIDTTGAGDLFAAGFLSGLLAGRPLAECLTSGAVCARVIIGQMGPRALIDLQEAVNQRLG